MFELIKIVWSELWPEIKPIVMRLAIKMGLKARTLLKESVQVAMQQTRQTMPDAPWHDRLINAVTIATGLIEAGGIQIGKEIYVNDIVNLITGKVEAQYQ